MNENAFYEAAKEHLAEVIQPNGDLDSLGWYLYWSKQAPAFATLDGEFSAEDLLAIAIYMKGTEP